MIKTVHEKKLEDKLPEKNQSSLIEDDPHRLISI